MKSLPFEDIHKRLEILRLKRRVGMVYGLMLGLAFAVSAWGVDGYLLSQAHAMYPWLKFTIGAVLCAALGGFVGWLVARLEKAILAPIFYLGLSFVFAWLVISLPFQIFPRVVAWLDPETGRLLDYVFYENFNSRLAIAFVWVGMFVTLAGILQIPLAEPAAFSTSIFGRIAPLIVCTVIVIINGTIVDSINNEPLRTPVLEIEDTIQFAVEHRGQEVDRAVSRAMHLASLRSVQDVIDEPRRLIVRYYDEWLGQVNVLVRFGDTWADCVTSYGQPSFCRILLPDPP